VKADWLEIEPATCQSQVQRSGHALVLQITELAVTAKCVNDMFTTTTTTTT